METVIRLATTADAALIADMSRQTFYDTFSADNSKADIEKFLSEQFTRDALKKEVGAAGNIFLLAYNDQQPVGYVRMRDKNNPPELGSDNSLEIARIYAVNDAIGMGVGKALMQYCIDLGKQMKKECIWLGVWERNERAIRFYTNWGFEKFAEHPFVLGDDIQTDWLMKKRID